jgi:mRNA interferase MazF
MCAAAMESRVMADLARGDVVFLSGGDSASQHLGVVVQSAAFAALPSVLICPLTEEEIDAPLLRVRLTPSDDLPLPGPVWAMAELPTAVTTEAVGAVIGRLSRDELRSLDRSLIAVLGLA